MTIEIVGQYVFSVSIGKYKDFIQDSDLTEFALFEEAGCVLPYFDLIFKFAIPDLRNYLVEDNVLSITFGSSRDDMRTLPFRIKVKNIVEFGHGAWRASIGGVYDAVSFLEETGTECIKGDSGENISATEALSKVTSRYFKFDTNVTKDTSNQKWLRCKKTTRDFAMDMWLHSTLNDSFPAVAITKDGKFLFKDIAKSVSEEPKWVFTDVSSNLSNSVKTSGHPEIINDSGIVSLLIQNKKNNVYDMDSGSKDEFTFEGKSMLANTAMVEESSSQLKDSINYITNGNVHTSYWNSYIHNLGFLTLFSGARAILSYTDRLIDTMQVLDVASYLPTKLDRSGETESVYSGKYLISQIVRIIGAGRNLKTHVTLSRESFNEVRDYMSELESQQPQMITEDTEYTDAMQKLQDAITNIKAFFDILGIKLDIPSMRILAQNLIDVFKGMFGYDEQGIWIKQDYLKTVKEANLNDSILRQIFSFLSERGETVILAADSSIMTRLLSGDFSEYITNSVLRIPNLGNTGLLPDSFTSSVFSWYSSGLIDEDNANTGNTDLDGILKDTVTYLKTTGIVSQVDNSMSRRYWGCLDKDIINELDIKNLYSDETKRRYLNKMITVKKGYIYLIYSTNLGEATIKINGKVYTNLEMKTRSLKLDGTFRNYFVYRTKDLFSSKTLIEVL